jgi:putative ATP-dependent endonuclease of the OLD family
MKLRHIRVKNFRCLKDVELPVDDSTILIGENNAGKTALLDALRKALATTAGARREPFDQFDFHMAAAADTPEKSGGILIELVFREDAKGEWPLSLVQALIEIIQTDPHSGTKSIHLRLSSLRDPASKSMVSRWEFLNVNGQPLGGKGASPANLTHFLEYVRLIYLSALRDPSDEFSSRSQFWGAILRDLKISDEQAKTLAEELQGLNANLLKADARLGQVCSTLDNIQKIVPMGSKQVASIQALPFRPWELLSRSEVVLRGGGTDLNLPLGRHGQGIQSLAVVFLFQAYLEVLLKPLFQPETEAILAMEEPESHLHPQAARALAGSLASMKAQKLISSHCPFFIQEIPLPQLRLFRRSGPSAKVLHLKREYSVSLPDLPAVHAFCQKEPEVFQYQKGPQLLRVLGAMDEKHRRELLTAYAGHRELHPEIQRLFVETQNHLSGLEIADLERFTKRVRGEIYFSRGWLLCEGQGEFALLRYFAEVSGTPLDQNGVSVIDFQNNGAPAAFVKLARAFEIPWILTCDNDQAGQGFLEAVAKVGLSDEEKKDLLRPLPGRNVDLEQFLVQSGLLPEIESVLPALNIHPANPKGSAPYLEEIAKSLGEAKGVYPDLLVNALRRNGAGAARVPVFFKELLSAMMKEVS